MGISCGSFLLPDEVVNERTGFRLEKSYVALCAYQSTVFHAICLRVLGNGGIHSPIHTVAMVIHPVPPFTKSDTSLAAIARRRNPCRGNSMRPSRSWRLQRHWQINGSIGLNRLTRNSVIKHGWEIRHKGETRRQQSRDGGYFGGDSFSAICVSVRHRSTLRDILA